MKNTNTTGKSKTQGGYGRKVTISQTLSQARLRWLFTRRPDFAVTHQTSQEWAQEAQGYENHAIKLMTAPELAKWMDEKHEDALTGK